MFNLFKKDKEESKSEDTVSALQFKLRGEPIIKVQHSGDFTEDKQEIHYYDENTMHGAHYTEEEFYAEAERRYQNFCSSYPHKAADTEKITFVMHTFEDWNNPDANRKMQFHNLYDQKISGYIKVTCADEIPDGEQWQPVMGMNLIDYAQIKGLELKGLITDKVVCKIFGIEMPIWDEIQLGWNKRFQGKDRSLFDAYMRFQTQPLHNPKLQAIVADSPTSDHVHLLMTDDYFWAEINAIMSNPCIGFHFSTIIWRGL